MIQIPRLFIVISTTMALVLLASCGPNSTNGTAKPSPTDTTSSVTLRVDATAYQTHDAISVTLSNQSPQTIYFPDHLTNCTVILLQRQVNGKWEAVDMCVVTTATMWNTLDAGQNLQVELIPSGKQWMLGLYRATLSYRTSLTFGLPTTIYSAQFQVN